MTGGPWTRSMKVVHGPGPNPWSMFCPHPLLRLWGPWSLNVLTISFVFLWVRGPAIMKTLSVISVWACREQCVHLFNPRQHTSTIRSSKHRRQMIKIIGPDYPPWSATNSARSLTFWPLKHWARSIQPKFPEISVQNSMDRFSPTEKVSEKMVHLFRWSSFAGRTGLNFGWMDRAHCRLVSVVKLTTFLAPYEHVLITCCLSFQVFRGSVFYF